MSTAIAANATKGDQSTMGAGVSEPKRYRIRRPSDAREGWCGVLEDNDGPFTTWDAYCKVVEERDAADQAATINAQECDKLRVALSKAERPVDYEALRQAFVAGAKWWEFQKDGATMWQSDQSFAYDEASKRYPNALARKVTDGYLPECDILPPVGKAFGQPTPEPAGERDGEIRREADAWYEKHRELYRLDLLDPLAVARMAWREARSRPVWTRDDLLQNIDAFAKGRCTRGELADAILRGMK